MPSIAATAPARLVGPCMQEASSWTTPSSFGRPPYPTELSLGSSSWIFTPSMAASSVSVPRSTSSRARPTPRRPLAELTAAARAVRRRKTAGAPIAAPREVSPSEAAAAPAAPRNPRRVNGRSMPAPLVRATVRDLGRAHGDVNLPRVWAVRTFGPLTPPIPLEPPGARAPSSIENPLSLARIAVAAIVLFATVVALVLWATGLVPRAIVLVCVLWALYGFAMGLLGGVLEPLTDGTARAFMDVGLERAGGGYSAIEALISQGRYADAAEAYRERAQDPAAPAAATLP